MFIYLSICIVDSYKEFQFDLDQAISLLVRMTYATYVRVSIKSKYASGAPKVCSAPPQAEVPYLPEAGHHETVLPIPGDGPSTSADVNHKGQDRQTESGL